MSNTRKRFAVMCLSSTIVLSPFSGLLSSSYSSTVAHAESKVTTEGKLVNFSGFLSSSYSSTVAHAQTKAPTEQLLANLTSEQLAAFTKLQTINETGLQLSKDVNLESTDKIPVIVEFKQRPAKIAVIEAASKGKKLSVTEAKIQVDASHDTFKKDIATIFTSKEAKKASSFSYKVNRSYKNAFNGVAMKLPANQVQSLLKSTTVKAVYSDLQVQVEPPVKEKNSEVDTLGKGMADERSYLQVDKLHEEGYTGKGVKVGVIDTGIDYNHPDLKDVFKGGYDIVDNDADPMETTYEDWINAGKPTGTYLTTHGTHVSGIIAGQGKNTSEYATTGIAPDAELYAYRVLGPYGSGTTAGVIAGIDRAVEDGMDVINLSLGAALNDPMFPTSMAVNNAVLSGVTAVVAAGNSGDRMYTLGSPGAAALALTVGASNVPIKLVSYKGSFAAGQDTVSADLRLLALGYGDDITKLKGQTLPVVYAGMGTADDFTGKDVKGKIALVSRGNNIALVDKIKAAKQNGAVAVLLFNNNEAEGHIPAYLAEGPDHIPTFSLTNADGLALKQKVEAGYKNFTFGEMTESKTQGDVLAGFSSRGPSRKNYEIKPEVTAPGVSVLSTVASDVVNGDKEDNYQYAYERMSGTSMASPHVAGIAALLLQADPSLQPEDVKTILMNTADPLSKPYSVFEVGAGRVDPYEAIHSDVEITEYDKTPMIVNGEKTLINEKTGGISFGQLAYTGKDIVDSRSVVLSNKGKTAKTFDVKVQFQSDLRGSKDAVKNGVKVQTDTSFKLKGKHQKKAVVSLFIPKTAEKGIYEGYVVYTNKDNPTETVQVPFGVNYEEKGFESFKVLTKTLTTTFLTDPNPFTSYSSTFTLNLKAHVKRVDFLLIDAKTNQYVGSASAISGQGLEPNTDYSFLGFYGLYEPFIGDPKKPFSTDAEYLNSSFSNNVEFLKPGNYKIKAIATDDQGKTFTAKEEEPFFVDNTAPEFKLDLPHGVYEYEAGQKKVPVSGSIYEENINNMKAAGIDISQAANKVGFYYNTPKPGPEDYWNQPNGSIPLNPNGTFAANIQMDESIPILPVRFYGQSISGAVDYPKMPTTYFVKKGAQYVAATPNKQSAKMGDTVTYTLTMHNAIKLKEQTFIFDYLGDYFDIESVTVNPELQKKANVELTHQELPGSTTLKKHSIDVSVKDTHQVIDGNISAVDVTLKVKDNLYYDDVLDLKNLTSSYINTEHETVSVPSLSVESYVIPTFSEVLVAGLEEGLPLDVDYTKAGATVTVTDENNQQYQGTVVNAEGNLNAKFSKLPVTSKEFMYHLHVPGQFEISRPFTVFKQEGETIRGESDIKLFGFMAAGDINGDQVIDIMDAVFMKQHWGTNTRSADINFDSKVDMKDFAFIEGNFLLVNETATNPPKPRERYNGETLESIKKELKGN